MSIELKPFFHEATVALADDFALHLVLDFSAVDRLERLLGVSIDDVIGEMLKSVSQMTKVLWAVTREHHADLSLDQVAGILMPADESLRGTADAVATTLGDLFKRAFNIASVAQQAKQAKKPRKSADG